MQTKNTQHRGRGINMDYGRKMNYLELVEFYMEEYGMDEESACRCADADTNPNYDADDYDVEW